MQIHNVLCTFLETFHAIFRANFPVTLYATSHAIFRLTFRATFHATFCATFYVAPHCFMRITIPKYNNQTTSIFILPVKTFRNLK